MQGLVRASCVPALHQCCRLFLLTPDPPWFVQLMLMCQGIYPEYPGVWERQMEHGAMCLEDFISANCLGNRQPEAEEATGVFD